jgi:hypothetical protein
MDKRRCGRATRVRVSAQVGLSIQVQDILMVLEAMKMETAITSPIAGKVARVHAKVEDAVQGARCWWSSSEVQEGEGNAPLNCRGHLQGH